MSVKNTEKKYGVVAKGFHWIIGLSILGLLAVGFFMTDLDRSVPYKFELYGIHKAIGISVLALASLRIIWRFINVHPSSLPSHAAWEKMLSKIIHFGLYIAMIGMPLSGWVMSSAGGHKVSFFGLFTVPAIVDKNPELGGLAHDTHGILGYVLLGMVALHIAGAAKHHILDRDITLTRMTVCGTKYGAWFALLVGGALLGTAGYVVALRLIFS